MFPRRRVDAREWDDDRERRVRQSLDSTPAFWFRVLLVGIAVLWTGGRSLTRGLGEWRPSAVEGVVLLAVVIAVIYWEIRSRRHRR